MRIIAFIYERDVVGLPPALRAALQKNPVRLPRDSPFGTRNPASIRTEDILISMDGRGRVYDNIFIERFWRTVKYEEIYLKAYGDALEASRELEKYFRFYNTERPRQSLDYRTPEEAYRSAGSCGQAA